MGIGIRIRELRQGQSLSQVELGRQIGLSQKAITSYELETREPSIETIKALAKVLGVKVEALFGEGRKGEQASKPVRVAKNKRSVKVQELFDQLPPNEQRVVLKQIKGLIPK